MTKAFILGAGLGNRLRPLTNYLPKPLVPLFHRPLAEWALAACEQAGIKHFAINNHHLPAAWQGFAHRADITMFHEPVLLETGGGLKNIASWLGDDSLLVHNGDIFSTLPLSELIATHEKSGLPVTLALRSDGVARHIALDPSATRVVDIRDQLKRKRGTHVFSGIYCVNASFLDLIPPNEKISVIPAFLELAKRGELGAVVMDEGVWLDLGDRESYLLAHRELALGPSIHPLATVEAGAVIVGSVIGEGAHIASGARLSGSVVWPHARVSGNAELIDCIIYSSNVIEGRHVNADL